VHNCSEFLDILKEEINMYELKLDDIFHSSVNPNNKLNK